MACIRSGIAIGGSVALLAVGVLAQPVAANNSGAKRSSLRGGSVDFERIDMPAAFEPLQLVLAAVTEP
jgi:hypothetical protein